MTSSPFSNPLFTLGIVGGGQLGKMLLAAARRMDIAVAVLDPATDLPRSTERTVLNAAPSRITPPF